MQGKFLVIEGLDGSGKTTQIQFILAWLKQQGLKVYLTDEPSKIGFKNLIKKQLVGLKRKIDDAFVDALLFTADRRIHLQLEILPALNNHDVVISDRYYHSTFAYQGTQGLDLSWLIELNRFARKPDLTIIFDVPAEIALERLRGGKRIRLDKYEKLEFLKRLRQNYLKLPKVLKEKIVVIDSSGTIEQTFDDVKKVIERELRI